jgi:hypothetical protein
MIKFFRNMRQNQLTEGKTGRYLKYAIGEIVLVVVGILIALSINNWNENRKVRAYELNQLNEIRENLIESKKEIAEDMEFNATTVELYQHMLAHAEANLPYDAALDSGFFLFANWQSPFLPQSGYETLKTSGINIIQNETLKKDIVKMHEQHFSFLINDIDKGEWVFSQSVVEEFAAVHLQYFDDGTRRYARPNDYESLKKNSKYKNILRILIRKRSEGVRTYEKTLKLISELIEKIGDELEKRSS